MCRPGSARARQVSARCMARHTVKLGALAGMTSVMLVMTIAQARIFFAMARDGLLLPFSARCIRSSARPRARSSPEYAPR